MNKSGNVFAILAFGLLASVDLSAGAITLQDLPSGDTDTLSIEISPANGAVNGVAGASVGWGFAVAWTSTDGDWISFTGSSVGSLAQGETNPGLLAPGGYTDFIGTQGGPVDFGLSPGSWTEAFDGVSTGVGSYQITTVSGSAVTGAQDAGQITFDFQVYNGDPIGTGVQIGDGSYSYYGSSTEFSVSVNAASPEPGTFGLLLFGSGVLEWVTRRLRRR